MAAKGRAAKEMKPRGERHGMAKLTAEIVRLARSLRAAGLSSDEIATQFGVHPRHMGKVLRGVAWAHVTNQGA